MNQCALLTITLLGSTLLGGLAESADSDSTPLKVVGNNEDDRPQNDFSALHDRPMSENETLIPQLMAAVNELPPHFLYELARRLWPTDKSAAMEWFAVGMARARYDALRCVDRTHVGAISVLNSIADDVAKGAQADRVAFGEAGLRAMARSDLFADSVSPSWICNHGIATMNAIKGKPTNEQELIRPQSEWKALRTEVRESLTHYFSEQNKPQDDPIPMTTAKFSRTSMLEAVAAPYGWLDSNTLAAAISEKDAGGKSVSRVVLFDRQGKQRDVAVTDGMWCAGSGTVTYQTGKEILPDRSQRITLAIGVPGRWSSLTLDLRQPFPNAFGPQDFNGGWSRPSNAFRQSPFDCRWVTDEVLSGPENANLWFPLRKGDGSIQFEGDYRRQQARWVDAKGKSTVLPIDANRVTTNSFRYLDWNNSYFVSETWSRFSHKEKQPPTCVAGVHIYPKDGRVEEVCAPFDAANTANAVMFHPTKIGWLRGTVFRNTPHGRKTGGIYLVRASGKAEKLVDGPLESWSVSPDGCRTAFALRTSDGAPGALEVIDLCS